jgi:hypothetical protein
MFTIPMIVWARFSEPGLNIKSHAGVGRLFSILHDRSSQNYENVAAIVEGA